MSVTISFASSKGAANDKKQNHMSCSECWDRVFRQRKRRIKIFYANKMHKISVEKIKKAAVP